MGQDETDLTIGVDTEMVEGDDSMASPLPARMAAAVRGRLLGEDVEMGLSPAYMARGFLCNQWTGTINWPA